jgi:hypothetical protein
MLARLGASLKAVSGGHLSYADLAATMGSALTNPERLLGTLIGSVHASWQSVTGNTDGAAFTENWRTEKLFPHLRAIADQPTSALQRWKLRDLLLNEQEGLVTTAQVLQLPQDQASAFLIGYPNRAAEQKGIAWQREYMGLEMGFHLLDVCALLELARKGFGVNPDGLQPWLDMYGKAFEHTFKVRAVLRTLHVIDPESFTPQSSQAAEVACEPIFSEMNIVLASMRDQISNGRANVDRFRELYNRLVDIKADFLRHEIGIEPPHSERI